LRFRLYLLVLSNHNPPENKKSRPTLAMNALRERRLGALGLCCASNLQRQASLCQ
jgi:hypothetical protein